MGYNEFDELGDKIQSIIDSAVNEKNYQKLSQSINQALNKAIDNGSDALRDALNNTVGSGKYTNYRSGFIAGYSSLNFWYLSSYFAASSGVGSTVSTTFASFLPAVSTSG